jgi:hypothetical protein
LHNDIPGAPYAQSDFNSVYRFNAASARLEGVRRPISAICETYKVDPTATNLKIIKAIDTRVDYAKIQAPRLGIFATYNPNIYPPWYPYLSATEKAKFRANWPPIALWQADAIARFRAYKPKGVKPAVFTIPSAPHYIFINDEAFVVQQMRTFLGLPLSPG